MRASRARAFVRGGFAAICALTGACSLLNSFGSIADPPITEAGIDGETDAGADASSDSPSDQVSVAQTGAIVLGASIKIDAGDDTLGPPVLIVLNPVDGTEIGAREKMTVAAVLYDGLRDLWYIFETAGKGFFPLPTDHVFLHVRTLDTHTGAWTELEKTEVPPLVSFSLMTVLRDRIVYVGYRDDDGAIGTDLVTLDTSSPAAVAVYDRQPVSPQPIGLIGTRKGAGAGGVINMLVASPCEAAPSPLCLSMDIVHVTVPSDQAPTQGAREFVSTYSGTPGFGSFITGGPVDVLALHDPAIAQYTVSLYEPQQAPPHQVGDAAIYGIAGPNIKPLAFAECLSQMLLVETNQDLGVYSVPMSAGGSVYRVETGHSGQGVYFEPYTSTVITPFSQGENFELTAFTLSGTPAQPLLTRRDSSSWKPPGDLRPNIVATRTPIGTGDFKCVDAGP